MYKNDILKLTIVGILVAMQIVLTRILSIQTPIVRIGFSFLPLALTAKLYGPLAGGISAVIADVIGMMLFPIGAFFIGFTITAFITGFLYGLFLYNRSVSYKNLLLVTLIIAVFINLLLNSYWLTILTEMSMISLLPTRIIRSVIMIPVQIITIKVTWKYLEPYLKTKLKENYN